MSASCITSLSSAFPRSNICVLKCLCMYVNVCRLDEEEDEVLKRLTNTFSAETNRRDDDDRM